MTDNLPSTVAIPGPLAIGLERYLSRADGQEDLCFAIWQPSTGFRRVGAVISEVLWPNDGDRNVHGNASFTGHYLLRALAAAAERSGGLALLHSHPAGRGWQGLSHDDWIAEATQGGKALSLTGLPMLGLTYASGDHCWSARAWMRVGKQKYEPKHATHVRVVGSEFRVSFNDELVPPVPRSNAQVRTVSAWGDDIQSRITRLHVAVVGAGSVGALVAESLARLGFRNLTLIDFDTVKLHNLDRLLHATVRDAHLLRSKVTTLARALSLSSAEPLSTHQSELSIVEDAGLKRALDADIIFSCVDRPWARAALNLIAYAHAIPVIDGGIRVEVRNGQMKGAEWRAHVAAPGRKCMACLGQYEPGDVEAERQGLLEDPRYLSQLPPDHHLRASENVFAFSMATAAAEVLEMLRMIVAPSGLSDVGALLTHYTTGVTDRDTGECVDSCLYSGKILGRADNAGFTVTGRHLVAESERQQRREAARRPSIRFGRRFDDVLRTLLRLRMTRSRK